MKLYQSGEDYLKAILILKKKSSIVRCTDLAQYMGYTKPSITHAVSTLVEGGFLTRDNDGNINLTSAGREIAEKIYERHCFFKDHLIAAGIDIETAEKEACQMEHSISQESYEKLKEVML